MTAPDNALSLTIAGTPDFGSEVLKALHRITGRATGELRRAIFNGEPVYAAPLFGNDHIRVVPRAYEDRQLPRDRLWWSRSPSTNGSMLSATRFRSKSCGRSSNRPATRTVDALLGADAGIASSRWSTKG